MVVGASAQRGLINLLPQIRASGWERYPGRPPIFTRSN